MKSEVGGQGLNPMRGLGGDGGVINCLIAAKTTANF